MLRDEARRSSRDRGPPDYRSVFRIFDTDNSGTIDTKEFKNMLARLHLLDRLPEKSIPDLLTKVDKKKGHITFEDFKRFVEEDDYGLINDENDFDMDDDYGLTSNAPPVAITTNSDADWLLWHLWREAVKKDPSDAEGVITELQGDCSEAELSEFESLRSHAISTISVKELFTLIQEHGLRGTMSHSQYDTAIKLFTDDHGSRDDDRVDFDYLCRSIIRMGRAFNKMMQERRKVDEKKYLELKSALQKELLNMGSISDGGKSTGKKKGETALLRFEKVMARLDQDGDGSLTVQEFKVALKRLRCRTEKEWTLRMIRRLFDELDTDNDGLLDVREFSQFLKSGEEVSKVGKGGATAKSHHHVDDDEDDIFVRGRGVSDTELFKKVSQVLQDIVPREVDHNHSSSGYSEERHIDTVRAAVRRFFVKTDPGKTGTAAEERFRAFCRRSGLQDKLTSSELRRLVESLRKKKAANVHFVDYEKFCRNLGPTTAAVGLSKAEAVLFRLQDAAIASASAGRSFLALCSLVDHKLTGQLSKQDLLYTFKMMGVSNLTPVDIDALKELLPNSASDKDGSVDYREVQWLLQHHVPNEGIVPRGHTLPIPGYEHEYAHKRTPAPIASPFNRSGPAGLGYTSYAPDTPYSYTNRSVTTPAGFNLSTPLAGEPLYGGHGRRETRETGGYNGRGLNESIGGSAYDKTVRNIAERTNMAIEEKSLTWGGNFSFSKMCEVYDSNLLGVISMRTFQGILDDQLGIMLTAPEIHAIYSELGRPEDDKVDYLRFCRLLQQRKKSGGGGIGGGDYGENPPYFGYKTVERVLQLRKEGRNPQDLFHALDLDHLGLIDARKFRDMLLRLQLFPTEHQLSRALEDFCNLTDRSMINYEEFCKALEKSIDVALKNSQFNRTVGRLSDSMRSGREGESFVYGNGYDGLSPATWDRERPGSPARDRDRRGSGAVYDNLNRFRHFTDVDLMSDTDDSRIGSGRVEREAGWMRDIPPQLKPSDSISLSLRGSGSAWKDRDIDRDRDRNSLDDLYMSSSGRLRERPPLSGSYSSTRDLTSSLDRDRDRDRLWKSGTPRSPMRPRSPPGKVAAVMWGPGTPLVEKGKPPDVDEKHWCCPVCYYVENPNGSLKCEVCQAPNYTMRKDYQVKEQCSHCTFLNGQFASECEMCQRPLAAGRSASSMSSSSKFKTGSSNHGGMSHY